MGYMFFFFFLMLSLDYKEDRPLTMHTIFFSNAKEKGNAAECFTKLMTVTGNYFSSSNNFHNHNLVMPGFYVRGSLSVATPPQKREEIDR